MWSGFSQRYSGLPTFFDASFSATISDSFFLVKRNGNWERENATTYTSADGESVRLVLRFDLNAGTPLLARVGLSYTGAAGASAHLAAIAGTSFEDLRSATEDLWQAVLDNFSVSGGTEKEKTIFYSALYRAFLMPTRFSDADNTYLGFDGATHAGASAYYSDLSLWDTFRTNFPLYFLSYPSISSDLVESLLLMYQEGGSLPRWASGAGYPNSMLGVPAVISLSEAFQKGVGTFDSDLALAASLEALSKNPSGVRGKECLSSYIDLGYCPDEELDGSVSYTLEYAYGDHALAQFYKAKGDDASYETYLERSRAAISSVFDHRFKSFLPKSRNGNFVDLGPDGPAWHDSSYLKLGKTGKAFVEGGVLHWRFYPIFDSDHVATLFGDHLMTALRRNFNGAKSALGGAFPPYYYWHGNEPGFMQAFWFSLEGSLSEALHWLHWIQTNKYSDTANGLDGDDDGGTLSAWYVLSAIGIFPIAGTDRYVLSNPVFDSVEIDIGSGETFTVTKTEELTNRVYLNGTLLETNEITHADIVNGAVLRFGDE
jgi:predicted alpha-1,2-mannosidase